MDGIHLNSDALRALLRASGAQKQVVAVDADLNPSRLTNYLTGMRVRTDEATRERLAAALSEALGFPVHARAITCHCPTPAVHEES